LIVILMPMAWCGTAFSQSSIPSQFMLGADLTMNINFFATSRLLPDAGPVPDYEQDFLGSMQGTSFGGSVLADFPAGQNNFIELRSTLEEIQFDKADIVIIPCKFYNSAGQNVGSGPATTEQSQTVSFTYLTLGAEFLRMDGHIFGSIGTALGPALENAYMLNSRIIIPDSCYYNYFGNSRSKTLHEEEELTDLNYRIPLTIRLGILIPFADRTYFAPSIGVNFGFFPINESGSTVTSIQPAVGIRYIP